MPAPDRPESTKEFIERFNSMPFPEAVRALGEEARKNLQEVARRAPEGAEKERRDAIYRRARLIHGCMKIGVYAVFVAIAWAAWGLIDSTIGPEFGEGLLVIVSIPVMFGAQKVGQRVQSWYEAGHISGDL